MPVIREQRPDEKVFYVEEVDSMGRSPDQIEAMDKNLIKQPRLRGKHLHYATMIAREHAEYPKVMYRLALRNGKPAGDEMSPSYPIPYDLAQQTGVADMGFKVIGKTKDSGGYIVARYPFITKSCGVLLQNGAINLEASKEMEKDLRSKGWVDNPNKIVGLPKTQVEEDEFDELPNMPKQHKQANL